MIPDDIKRTLHDIRLIGGGVKKYEHPDDWQLIRNLIGEKMNVDLSDATLEYWDEIRASLEKEKSEATQIADKRYFGGLYNYNPFVD